MPRIVIIEDDAPIREVLVQFLAEEGYEPLALHNDGDLAAHLVAIQPDLVLLDLLLGPWGNGMAVAAKMRSMPLLTRTPLIVMTAAPYLLAQYTGDLQALNCQVISKPFDLDGLLTCIRDALAATCSEDVVTGIA